MIKHLNILKYLGNNYSNFRLLAVLMYTDTLIREDILYIVDKMTTTIDDDILIKILINNDAETLQIKSWFKEFLNKQNLNITDWGYESILQIFTLINNKVISVSNGMEFLFEMQVNCDFASSQKYMDFFWNTYFLYEESTFDPYVTECGDTEKRNSDFVNKNISNFIQSNGNCEFEYPIIDKN